MATRVAVASDAEMVRRLLSIYDGADAETRRVGAAWYADAAAVAERLAALDGHRPDRAADALAALSPRLRWMPNVRAVLALVRAHAAGADAPPHVSGVFRRSLQQGWTALHGGGAGTGPKVSAFACNIRTRGLPCRRHAEPCVTVDSIAARAALGLPSSVPMHLTRAQYRAIADAYRRAAAQADVAPAHFQAIVWVATRPGGARACRREWAAIERLFEEVKDG